ncbi:MAG: polysaccharide deacetylase family protein [archaeon]
MKLAITIDVEPWDAPSNNGIKTDELTPSLDGLASLLSLFREHNAKSTLFVSGNCVSRLKPALKQAVADGHEIASHGQNHMRYTGLSKEKVAADVSAAEKSLSKLGVKPIGFRAPGCRYTEELAEVLTERGYKYDSSLHPTFIPGHYNNILKPNQPFRLNDCLLEIPLSVFPLIHQPISWWWMRNIGVWWTQLGARLNSALSNIPILYFHSWEFAELPRFDGIGKSMYRNTGKPALQMLESLIKGNQTVLLKDISD